MGRPDGPVAASLTATDGHGLTGSVAAGVLAIDLGTTGVKVAVVDERGRVVAGAGATFPTTYGADGAAEQDATAWWAAIGSCARRVVAEAGGPTAVDLVAVTAQYMSLVAVDARGEAIAPVVMWMDRRGAAHHPSRQWDDAAGLDALMAWIDRHGIPTGGGDSIGQLAFVRSEWPQVWAAAAAFVQPVDHLLARLTGVVAATQNSAFPLLLTDNRTWGELRYDDELIARCGLPADELIARLPRLVPFGEPRGELTAAAAEHLGLRDGVVVAGGTIDTTTSAVGTGAVGAGRLGVVIGTTAVVLAHLGARSHDLANGITSGPSPVPASSVVIAENGVGGKALDAFVTNLVAAADGLTELSPATGLDPFAAVLEQAAGAPAGANGVLYAPWLVGAMAPSFDPLVRGAFVGLGVSTSRADLARAVVEGVACNLARLVPHVAALTGTAAGADGVSERPIVLGGGGAASALWGQVLADATGRRVRRLAEPRFTNVRGAAFVALAEQGRIGWDDIDALLVVESEHLPDAARHRLYARQTAALGALQEHLGAFHRSWDHHHDVSSPEGTRP